MSRDSLYQQLRTHLAYLNLGAAAEALPAIPSTKTNVTKQINFLDMIILHLTK